MTPITERLAEALREIAEYVAVNEMSVAPQLPSAPYKMKIIARTALAEYDRLRTHPAEGGEGREIQRLRDIEHHCWHILDDSEDDGENIRISKETSKRDLDALYKLLPEDHPVTNTMLAESRQAATTTESSAAFLARMDDDATKWAAEFRKMALSLGYSDMDEGWLIGWFANAIEHSCDVRRWRVAPERGEAKAVAWITESALLDLERWTQAGRVACATVWNGQDAVRKIPVYLATPQPPPAPTFRDPTIEDAEKCPRCGRRRTTGAGRLPEWPSCCTLVCHCTCHNDPLYCRECKDCDCHKAALPPQPVAPERGEAKAVAPGNGSFQIGWYNTKYKAFFKMDEQDSTGRTHEMLASGEIIRVYANATPQPPPAPRFRDPTIEDDLRAIADDVDPNHDPMPSNHPLWDPYKQADRLRQIANAIGAKVEEKP